MRLAARRGSAGCGSGSGSGARVLAQRTRSVLRRRPDVRGCRSLLTQNGIFCTLITITAAGKCAAFSRAVGSLVTVPAEGRRSHGLEELGECVRAEPGDEQDQRDTPPRTGRLHRPGAARGRAGAPVRRQREAQREVADQEVDRAAHSRPSRDTARSHTPDAPRAIERAAACSEVPAVLPGPRIFFNGLASARQYARPQPPAQCRPARCRRPLTSAPPGRPGIPGDPPSSRERPARRPYGVQGSGQLPGYPACPDAWPARLPAASGVPLPGRDPEGARPGRARRRGDLAGIRIPS